jgi:hypothetical protein
VRSAAGAGGMTCLREGAAFSLSGEAELIEQLAHTCLKLFVVRIQERGIFWFAPALALTTTCEYSHDKIYDRRAALVTLSETERRINRAQDQPSAGSTERRITF